MRHRRNRMGTAIVGMALAGALAPFLAAPVSAQLPPPGSAQSWFFAEGNTLPNWFEFITVINPSPTEDITVNVEYQLEEPAGFPAGTRTRTLDVAAGQRQTLAVYDDLGRAQGAGLGQTGVYTGVSARLTSTANFVAERPMYFVNNFDVGEVNGAHDALGVNGASTTWYFAEGSTLQTPAPDATGVTPGAAGQLRGFMPFFTMQNVSGANATVTVTYRTNNPDSVVEKTITVPNNSRITTDIANAFNNPAYPGSLGPGFEGFGTTIASDQPIIVERPFYVNREFPGIGFVNAATDERGALTANTTTRLFSEGTVLEGFFEFLTIFNPNTTDSILEFQYQVEGQTSPVVKNLTVPALSRRTVQVYDETSPGGLGRAAPNASAPGSAGVSVRIVSTNGVGFVAERPMYFIRDFGNGPVNGAHDVLGAGVPDTSWFFAEGTLRNGFFEFIAIQNPNADEGRARLDYFINGQPIQTGFRDLPPNSRVTVVAFDSNSEGSLAQQLSPAPVPADVDFGLRVTSIGSNGRADSSKPIVVERPMYVNSVIAGQPPAINGGHNTLGFQFPAGEVPLLPGEEPQPTGPAADLAIAKADSADPVPSGAAFSYTLTIGNAGPDAADSVTAVDALPSGVTFGSADASQGSCTSSGQTVTCVLGTIASGGSASVTIQVQATSPAGTTLSNSATVSSSASDPNTANNSDTETTAVSEAQADVVVDKTHQPANPVPGGQITYTIAVDNDGPSPAENVVVSDQVPSEVTGVTAVSTADTCTVTGQNVNCSIGTINAGAGAVVTINGTIDDGASTGPITNTAQASSTTTDPNTGNNQDTDVATIMNPSADLALDKTHSPDSPTSGGTIQYTLTVANNGPTEAANVVITDTVPAGLSVTAVSTTRGSCDNDDDEVTCTITTFLADDTAVVRIDALIDTDTDGTVTNTAQVRSDDPDPVPGNNADADVVTIVSDDADLSVKKTHSPLTPTAGSPISYTITVRNDGPADATATVVSDSLPAEVSHTGTSSTRGTCAHSGGDAGGEVTCSIGTMTDTSVVTITIRALVDPGTPDGAVITNVVTVDSTTDDPDRSDNRFEETATVQARADMVIEKTHEQPAVNGPNGGVTYTIGVANNGPSDAQNVVITDVAPAEVTLTGVVFVSGNDGTCDLDDHAVTCTVPVFAADSFAGVIISATVSATAGSSVVNAAGVRSTTVDPGPGPNHDTDSVTVRGTSDPQDFNVRVTKTRLDTPIVREGAGQVVLTYTITVTNTGALLIAPIEVQDTVSSPLSRNATFTADAPEPPCTPFTLNATLCTFGLAGGASASVTITVTVTCSRSGGALISQLANMVFPTMDADSDDNAARVVTPVICT